jgi:putative salt-induced outer membrane protein YdiY
VASDDVALVASARPSEPPNKSSTPRRPFAPGLGSHPSLTRVAFRRGERATGARNLRSPRGHTQFGIAPQEESSVNRSLACAGFFAGFVLLAASAHADKVRLKNGDVVTGEIVETSDAGVVLEHAVLGRFNIAADQIDAQVDGDAALPAPPPPPRPGLFGSGVLAGWNKQVQLGVTGSKGNSETQDILAGVRGNFADETKRWQFDSGYFRASTDGNKTKSQAFAMLLRDFLFTGKKYFAFASTRYDWDQFQEWDHRLSLAAGLGYSFLDGETFDLRGRAGFGTTKTFGSPGDDEWVPEAVIGLETEWLPAERQKITAYTTFYPSLSDGGEFRNLSGVDWSLLIADGLGLSLNLGVQNEYESDVAPGIEKNDLLYRAALLYDF